MSYVLRHVNGKIRSIETIQGSEGRGGQRRMMEGVNSGMIYCKNICKCHNVSPAQK
jgi:hypothetical protein